MILILVFLFPLSEAIPHMALSVAHDTTSSDFLNQKLIILLRTFLNRAVLISKCHSQKPNRSRSPKTKQIQIKYRIKLPFCSSLTPIACCNLVVYSRFNFDRSSTFWRDFKIRTRDFKFF